ncbi:Type II secretion system F domain protein (fragment) [Kyrpidia spormannii]|uniref:Type II secretion system F domain protein n=1 Tax=Kyrpidia spormannii TaxID=2055160 RepID=A0ACA8ZDF5_9BACL
MLMASPSECDNLSRTMKGGKSMALFRYQAVNGAGKTVRGQIEASDAAAAGSALRQQGLFPMRIDPVERRAGGLFGALGRRHAGTAAPEGAPGYVGRARGPGGRPGDTPEHRGAHGSRSRGAAGAGKGGAGFGDEGHPGRDRAGSGVPGSGPSAGCGRTVRRIAGTGGHGAGTHGTGAARAGRGAGGADGRRVDPERLSRKVPGSLRRGAGRFRRDLRESGGIGRDCQAHQGFAVRLASRRGSGQGAGLGGFLPAVRHAGAGRRSGGSVGGNPGGTE